MLDRLISALVALSMAFLVWLYARSRDQETLDSIPVPVQVLLPPGQEEHYDLEVTGPAQVPVSFTGPPSRIRELRHLLQRGELRVVMPLAIPAERAGDEVYRDTLRIESDDLHPPPGVTSVVVEGRNRIGVVLRRLVERQLPVRFESTGGWRFASVQVEPPRVLVRGPQEILEQARDIPTLPYALPASGLAGRTAPSAASPAVWRADGVPLVQEMEGRRVRVTPATVRVRLMLQPPQKLYELAEVPVQFLCPANFGLRPLFGDERAGKITLRVLGPAAEEPPAVLAFVDLGGRKWEPGLYEEPLKLQLPKEFQLAQTAPRSVAFQLVPAEGVAKTAGVMTGH
jgi:hypothetical protein